MWLPSLDSNQGYVVQSHACYRYTTRQRAVGQCNGEWCTGQTVAGPIRLTGAPLPPTLGLRL